MVPKWAVCGLCDDEEKSFARLAADVSNKGKSLYLSACYEYNAAVHMQSLVVLIKMRQCIVIYADFFHAVKPFCLVCKTKEEKRLIIGAPFSH